MFLKVKARLVVVFSDMAPNPADVFAVSAPTAWVPRPVSATVVTKVLA